MLNGYFPSELRYLGITMTGIPPEGNPVKFSAPANNKLLLTYFTTHMREKSFCIDGVIFNNLSFTREYTYIYVY